MIKITIVLEEALGADKTEVSNLATEAIYKALEQPAIEALFIDSNLEIELGINPEFYPPSGMKGVEKTDANSCQISSPGGSWVISTEEGDAHCYWIGDVIKHINRKLLYITNETIMPAEYASQLWYKRKA